MCNILVLAWKYPFFRGILFYLALWPLSCIIQQKFSGKALGNLDWYKILKFAIYGGFVRAPVVYAWIKFTSAFLFRRRDIKTVVKRVALDQLVFGPFSIICFYFVMSYFTDFNMALAWKEVVTKFWTTYKTGVYFWPIFQTINYYFVSDANRVSFLGVGTLVWNCFLSYMVQKSE